MWLAVVKSLHPESRELAYMVRCYNFSIIMTYRIYAEIIEKLHASNMRLFGVRVYTLVLKGCLPTYPSKLRFLRVYHQ